MATYRDINSSVRIGGDLSIPAGSITLSTQITLDNASGQITATKFSGDGSLLTNLSSSAMTDVLLLSGTRAMTGGLLINRANAHLNLQESGTTKWHFESVAGTVKIVETNVATRLQIAAGGATTISGTLTTTGNVSAAGYTITATTINASSNLQENGTNLSSKYVQLVGGTITGNMSFNAGITFNPAALSTAIGSIFGTNTTQKSYINFTAASGSNDPGYIMHETTGATANANNGVIHIAPTDDNARGDYVAIHGTNDPETIRIHTDGYVETPQAVKADSGFIVGATTVIGSDAKVDWSNLKSVPTSWAATMITTDSTHRFVADTDITNWNGKLNATDNAVSASKWATARTITLGGDTSGSVLIDGTANATLTITVTDDSHEHTRVNHVDKRDAKPADTPAGYFRPYFTSLEGLTGVAGTTYQDLLVMNTYTDASGGKVNALAFDKTTQTIRHYLALQTDTTWGTPKTIAYTDSSITGNAATATKLATARTFAITGDVAASAVSFDGTGNISLSTTLPTVNSNVGTFSKVTVNAKGQVTAAVNIGSSDVTTALGFTPVNKAGDTMTGLLTLSGDPTSVMHAVTKQFVDRKIALQSMNAFTSKTTIDRYTAGAVNIFKVNGNTDWPNSAAGLIVTHSIKDGTSDNQTGVWYPGSVHQEYYAEASNSRWHRYALVSKAYNNISVWVASTAVALNALYMPTGDGNGYYYKCTTAGTTSATEPTWPSSGTVTDGTVVWTLQGSFWSAWDKVLTNNTIVSSDIPNLDWSKITSGKPTTQSGYGITDVLNLSGGTMTGAITLSGDPTANLHATTKQYVDVVDTNRKTGAAYIQAQHTLTGGGTVTWDGTSLKWTARFIAIPINKRESSTGYVEMNMPASGTVIAGIGTTASVTVTASGVPLSGWKALYAVHTIGGTNASITYYVSDHTGASTDGIPTNAILVAANNADTTTVRLGTGQILTSGDSITIGKASISTINGLQTALDSKVDKITGMGLSTNDYTTTEKSKLSGISTGANKSSASTTNGNFLVDGAETVVYTHPSTHPATMIVADSTHRFVADSDISNWNAKATTAEVTETTDGLMIAADKTKLDGISTGANKAGSSTTNGNILIDAVETAVYTLPATLPATMITTDSTHRFVADTDITNWNAKANASITISTSSTSGLTGGGDLTANRSLAINFAGNGTATSAARSDHTHALSILTDTTITSVANGNFLRYNGTKWININLVSGDIPSLDWSKITTGVPSTLAGYNITDAMTKDGVGGYTTANTGASNGGQWTKVATITTTSQYGFGNISLIFVAGADGATTFRKALVDFRSKQQGVFGSNPLVEVNVLEARGITAANFVANISQNTPSTIVDLYMQIPNGYEAYKFSGQQQQASSTTIALLSTQPWLATIPTGGTQVTANDLTAALATDVVTTATANKLLKLDSNSKLPTSITGNADGNAATATKLATARTIAATGDISATAISFDGSANISLSTTLATVNSNVGTYTKVTVNAKGLVTSATTLSASDIPNLDWTKITTGKPTTVSGFGITDALTTAGGQTVSGSMTHSGSVTVNNTLTVNGSSYADRLYQNWNGNPTSNLGAPSVAEIAFLDKQFTNKTWFYNPSLITFDYTMDGTTWTTMTVATTTIADFVSGRNNTTINIPNKAVTFRITIQNDGTYVFLNALYMYWSSQSHSTKVTIEKSLADGTNTWTAHTSSATNISAWPGHMYLPFSTIAFNKNSTTQYGATRIVFTPTWSSDATYGTYPIALNGMEIWGGYPSGFREIYSWDRDKNVTFPAALTATAMNVGSSAVWHAGNFTPGNYLTLSGGTVTGGLTVNGGVSVGGSSFTANGFDFILGIGDQSSRGNTGGSRALVKAIGGILAMNYAGDFTGGVEVQGSAGMKVDGQLTAPSFYVGSTNVIDTSGKVDWSLIKNTPSSWAATMITTDSTHRFVADTDITNWNGKVNNTTTVGTSSTSGLTGGGALSSSLSLAVNFAGTGSATTVSHSDHDHGTTYLKTAGDTMTGVLTMGANNIIGNLSGYYLSLNNGATLSSVGNLIITADSDSSSISEAVTMQAGKNILKLTSNAGSTNTTGLTYNGNQVWHSDNDGSGSGLDADYLDGNDSTYFATADAISGHSFNYSATYNVAVGMAASWFKISTAYNAVVYLDIYSSYDNSQQREHAVVTIFGYNMRHHITSTTSDYNTGKLLQIQTNNNGSGGSTEIWIQMDACTTSAGSFTVRSSHAIPTLTAQTAAPTLGGTGIVNLVFNATNRRDSSMLITRGIRIDNNIVWHQGNDGAGSGLDADLLDGIDSSKFVRNDMANSISGNLTLTGNLTTTGTTTHTGATVIDGGGGVLSLKPGTSDQVYIQLYADTQAASTRSGWIGYGSAGTNLLTIENDMTNGNLNLVSNGTGAVQANGNTIWHAGNLTPISTGSNQTTGSGFTVGGTLYVGSTSSGTNNGDVVIRGAGNATIHLDGDGSGNINTGTVKAYVNGSTGDATLSGKVTANSLAVSSNTMVSNLNAELFQGNKPYNFDVPASNNDMFGYGVSSGMQPHQGGATGPDATVKIDPGTVYTSSGRRFVFATSYTATVPAAYSAYNRYDVYYVRGPVNTSGASDPANEGTIQYAQGATDGSVPTIPAGSVSIVKIYVPMNPQGGVTVADGSTGETPTLFDNRKWIPFRYDSVNTWKIDGYLQVLNDITEGGSFLRNKYAQLATANTFTGNQTINGAATINYSPTIGGNTPANGALQITGGGATLAFDANEIYSTSDLWIEAPNNNVNIGAGAATTGNNITVKHTGHLQAPKNATTVTIPAGQTSVTWTHNYGATTYAVNLTSNSFERHVRWNPTSKLSNSIVIEIDVATTQDVLVDCILMGY